MHLLFSNFKKTSQFISSGKTFPVQLFLQQYACTCTCIYHIDQIFSPDKDIHNNDRYWSLACYRSIFKVHSKCIYAIILHTTQGWTTQVVIYRLNIGRKKTWRYIPPSVHFRKNPIFDTVNLLNTKILCIFNVKLSTFPSDHLALRIYDIVNLWWINYRW